MSNQNDNFPTCAICGADSSRTVYVGPIRDGAFGVWREARVCRCDTCGVDRVTERFCLPIETYESVEYRHLLKQDQDAGRHNAAHDELARFTLDTIWPTCLRGKTVADLGCGGGALLDRVRGLTSKIVTIDPSKLFAPSLNSCCYYSSRGRTPMAPLDVAIDHYWQVWLESTSRAENFYLIAHRAHDGDS